MKGGLGWVVGKVLLNWAVNELGWKEHVTWCPTGRLMQQKVQRSWGRNKLNVFKGKNNAPVLNLNPQESLQVSTWFFVPLLFPLDSMSRLAHRSQEDERNVEQSQLSPPAQMSQLPADLHIPENHCKPDIENFFCKGPNSKHLRLFRPFRFLNSAVGMTDQPQTSKWIDMAMFQ